jgi:hypothetical protein
MHLENVASEETEIRKIEIQIGESRDNDEVDFLKRKRIEIYESWINRLNR